MSVSEEVNPKPAPSAAGTAAPARRRRGHRGGRGRRGGALKSSGVQAAPPAAAPTEVSPASPDAGDEAAATPEEAIASPASAPVSESVPAPAPPTGVPRSREPIQEAITRLNHIISDLRAVLVDLEDVAELLEIIETQKLDDTGEIETLQRTLDQLQRTREHGSSRSDRPARVSSSGGSQRRSPMRR